MRHPKTGYVKTVKKGYPGLYYVRAIPVDVRAAIGKTKWSIPLDTANHATATAKARALAVEHDALIESHRRPDPMESLSPAERQEIAERGGLELYRRWLESLKREADHLTDEAEGYRQMAVAEIPTGPQEEPPVDPVWARSKAAAFIAEAQENRVALSAGMALITKVEDLSQTSPSLASTPSLGTEPLTLTELCEKYLIARNPVNQNAYRNVAKAFEKLNGRLLLKDITKQHVRTYRDALATCGYAESTAQLVFKRLKTMLIFAAEDDYLSQNPAATLPWAWPHIESLAEADDKARRTFTHEEAKRYLDAAEKLAATDRSRSRDRKTRTRWIILLMMYSGARGEEICQLSPGDVKNIGGVWCLSIHDREWRKLKTSNSLRDIPLHKRILELGFLDFVTSRKGKQLLFSDRLATKKTRCYPRHADEVRALLRNDAKVTDSRAVPYSSRHTVKDCLRLVEAPKYVEDRILGHGSTANKIADSYGEVQIVILKKWIDTIDPLDKRRTTTTFKEDED